MAFKNECAIRNRFSSLIVSSFYVVGCESFKQGFGINKLREVWLIDYNKYSFQFYSTKDFAVLPQVNCISAILCLQYLYFIKILRKLMVFKIIILALLYNWWEWHRAVIVCAGFGTLCYIQNYKEQREICN